MLWPLSSLGVKPSLKPSIIMMLAVMLLHSCRLHHSFSFFPKDMLQFNSAREADASSGLHCEYGSLNTQLQKQLENRDLLRLQLQSQQSQQSRGKAQSSVWDCPTCTDTNVLEQLLGRESSRQRSHEEVCTTFEITVDMRDSSHTVEQYEFQKSAMQETIVLLQKNKEQIEQIAASLYYTIELKDSELESQRHRIESLEASTNDAVQELLSENAHLKLDNGELQEALRAKDAEVAALKEEIAALQRQQAAQHQQQEVVVLRADVSELRQLQLQLNATLMLLEDEKLASEQNQRLLEATESALEQLQLHQLELANASCPFSTASAAASLPQQEQEHRAVAVPLRPDLSYDSSSFALVPFEGCGYMLLGLLVLSLFVLMAASFCSEFVIYCFRCCFSRSSTSFSHRVASTADCEAEVDVDTEVSPCAAPPPPQVQLQLQRDHAFIAEHSAQQLKLMKQSDDLKERREGLHRQMKHINEALLADSERVLASQCMLQSEKSALLLQLQESSHNLKHAEGVIHSLQEHLSKLKQQHEEVQQQRQEMRSVAQQTSALKSLSPTRPRSLTRSPQRVHGGGNSSSSNGQSSPLRPISSPFALNPRENRNSLPRTPSTIKRKVFASSRQSNERLQLQGDDENMQCIANRLHATAPNQSRGTVLKPEDDGDDVVPITPPPPPRRGKGKERSPSSPLARSPTPADLKSQIKVLSSELQSMNVRLEAALQQEADTQRHIAAKKLEVEGLEAALKAAAEELIALQRSHAEEDEIKDELLEAYRLQLESVSHELTIAKQQLSAVGEGESALQEQLLQKQKEIERMRSALDDAGEQLSRAKAVEEEACGDVLALNDEMVRQQQESVAALLELQDRIDDLTSQNSKLMQQIMHTNEHHAIEVHLLQTDLNTTSIELAAAVEKLHMLQTGATDGSKTEKDDEQESKQWLKGQLQLHMRRCEEIEAERTAQLQRINEQLRVTEQQFNDQKLSMQSLQAELKHAASEQAVAAQLVKEHELQLIAVRNERDTALASLDDVTGRANELHSTLTAAETDNAALIAKVQRQNSELSGYLQHFKQSEEKMKQLQGAIASANLNINDLRRSVLEKEQIIRILESDIEAMQEKNGSASANISVQSEIDDDIAAVVGEFQHLNLREKTESSPPRASTVECETSKALLQSAPPSPEIKSSDSSRIADLDESLTATFARIQAEIDSTLPENALRQAFDLEQDADIADDAEALLQRLALLRSLNEEKDEIIATNKAIIYSLQTMSQELKAELAVTKQKLAEYENSITSLREHAAQVQRAQREWRQRHGRGFRSAPTSASNSKTSTPI